MYVYVYILRVWSCLRYIVDYFVLWILTLYYFEHSNTLLLFYTMSMLNNCDLMYEKEICIHIEV